MFFDNFGGRAAVVGEDEFARVRENSAFVVSHADFKLVRHFVKFSFELG